VGESISRTSRALFVLLISFISLAVFSCSEKKVSFSQEVFPILKKRCLSCHYPGNEFNESRLVMTTYELLLKGGVHGSPIVPGKADSSLIVRKLGPDPPFGRQMPLMSKEKLSSEEIVLIAKWIDQGAKDN